LYPIFFKYTEQIHWDNLASLETPLLSVVCSCTIGGCSFRTRFSFSVS